MASTLGLHSITQFWAQTNNPSVSTNERIIFRFGPMTTKIYQDRERLAEKLHLINWNKWLKENKLASQSFGKYRKCLILRHVRILLEVERRQIKNSLIKFTMRKTEIGIEKIFVDVLNRLWEELWNAFCLLLTFLASEASAKRNLLRRFMRNWKSRGVFYISRPEFVTSLSVTILWNAISQSAFVAAF